jgi:hypothetical protein
MTTRPTHEPIDADPIVAVPRAAPSHWIVVRENGEHYHLEKPPLEGFEVWAAGQDVTVYEYAFVRVAYAKGKKA